MEDHTLESLLAAKRLRRKMSLPEVLLWNKLRGKPMGLKFRNQHPLDTFVVDFYCARKKVAIEIDGIAHDMGDRPDRDAHRFAKLRSFAVEVLKIPAVDVLRDVDEAPDAIVQYCMADPPPSALRAATSPKGEGF